MERSHLSPSGDWPPEGALSCGNAADGATWGTPGVAGLWRTFGVGMAHLWRRVEVPDRGPGEAVLGAGGVGLRSLPAEQQGPKALPFGRRGSSCAVGNSGAEFVEQLHAACDVSLVTGGEPAATGGGSFRPWPPGRGGLEQAVLGAELLGLGVAGGGLVREAGGGGFGAQALVAAAGALVGGVVVVGGVGAAQAAAGAAPGAGSGGAGVGGRLPGALAGAFPLAAGALLVVVALLALLVGVGVLLAALAGAVAGGAAAAGAVLAAAAGVVGLAEGGAAVRAVGVDGGDHRFVTSRANEKATRRGGAGWPSGRVASRGRRG